MKSLCRTVEKEVLLENAVADDSVVVDFGMKRGMKAGLLYEVGHEVTGGCDSDKGILCVF